VSGAGRAGVYLELRSRIARQGLSTNAPRIEVTSMDLSRFECRSFEAFTATKETDYGLKTDGRIPPRCGAYRADTVGLKAHSSLADELGWSECRR